MRIIYVDNHLLVLDKPAGWLTQPDGASINLQERAKAWIAEVYRKPGRVFLEPIHRLDRPVSGLVVCARTSKSLSRLQAAMRAGKFRKWYRAQVEGSLPKEEGILEHYLVHGDHRALLASPDQPGAKRARLHYRVTASPGTLEIELETGRYHQIRAQFAAIGCPIVGDHKYGSRSPQESAIALSHERCEFPHPITGELLRLDRMLPQASICSAALPT